MLGISSRVNCIINPQAVKRQARPEFTLEPSLSHGHNLALCARVSDTTLIIRPRLYLRENAISQMPALQLHSRHFNQSDAGVSLWRFLFSLSLICLGFFFVFFLSLFFFGGGLDICRI